MCKNKIESVLCTSCVLDVVGDDLDQLGEVPAVPLAIQKK